MKPKLTLLISSLFLVIIPIVSFAQINPAPVIGTTSNFVLFTSVGDITNSGTTSTYLGSVGTNAGALTGFGSLITQPTHLYNATPQTTQCAVDLTALYNDLAARTGTVRVGVYSTETLAPGVYTTAGAVNVAEILTLDGGGDSNARFIIKTGGAFTMAAGAKILLTNGTQAKNVFWVIAGAAAIAANCEVRGMFVCHTGSISMGANAIMEGGALTIAGAITTLDGMTLAIATTNTMVLTQNQTIVIGAIPADLVLTGNISPVIKWQSASNSTFTTPTDILHYSTSLSASCIGSLTTTTFYRAVILIDGVNAYSNSIKITTVAAAPNMGAASPFVLFTTAGAITNAGISTYLGNIGTHEGAISGFTNLSDPLLHTADALTLACKDYLLPLFNSIKNITTTNSHTAALGAGEILVPGVYEIASAATLGGILTLNGLGSTNSIFIIKITGALALAANSKIILTNGAIASNVFWVIDGALGVGASCEVRGNFISLAGAIALGNNTITEGRIFTIAGAITLENTTFTFVTTNNIIVTSVNQVVTYGSQPTNITITGNADPVVRWEKSSDFIFTSPITIANTTTTLTGLEIGAMTATSYFRAVVLSGATTIYSSVVTLSVSGITIAGVVNSNQLLCGDSIPANLILTGNNGQVTKWQRSLTPNFLSPTDINSNSTTLTGTIIGSLSATTYFRAVVQNCTSDVIYSTTAVLTIDLTTSTDGGISWSNGVPSSSKSIVFDGSIGTISADLAACSIRLINNAVVTVPSGFNVTLNGKLTVDSGSTFTLENNTNLMQNTTIANSGNIIVKRNSSALKRLDYSIWSSPVTGQGLYAFSKFTLPNRFYRYDTPTNLYSNSVGFNLTGLQYPDPLVAPIGVNGTDTNNVLFATAKGYLIRMPWNHPATATVWNGTFTGVPNNGDVAVAITTGYNAVGNPYPSRINVSNFIDGNPNITGPLYFWRKTNNSATTSYATLTKIAYVANAAEGGDTGAGYFNIDGNGVNDVINVGQGFIVYATSSATLNFTNSMRRGLNEDQFFRTPQTTSTTNNGLYWLNLTNSEGVFSQMAVGYSPEGTLADDRGIDGKNINQEFYLTSLIGTAEYSIQGRPDFQADDIVLLSYKAATAGNYTISIDHTAGVFTGSLQPIYLKDNLTSALHNLKTGGYTFTSEAGTFANRFEIVYQTTLDINNPNFNTNNVIIYNQNNAFVVNTENIIMSSIKVFDIRGRVLQEIKGINASQATINGGLSNQVLLVQITSTEGLTVTKKVMR